MPNKNRLQAPGNLLAERNCSARLGPCRRLDLHLVLCGDTARIRTHCRDCGESRCLRTVHIRYSCLGDCCRYRCRPGQTLGRGSPCRSTPTRVSGLCSFYGPFSGYHVPRICHCGRIFCNERPTHCRGNCVSGIKRLCHLVFTAQSVFRPSEITGCPGLVWGRGRLLTLNRHTARWSLCVDTTAGNFQGSPYTGVMS